MSYKIMSIKTAIAAVREGKMYLPAIQRKYVWSENQITKLFDSILKGYPIGTFLFWKLEKKTANKNNYLFYQFIKDYHERDNYINTTAPMPFPLEKEGESFFSVLDGQQRLTSLYIALQGSLSLKKFRSKRATDSAYTKKELYFNIESDYEIANDDDDDDKITYEFKFFAEDDILDTKWFKVKDILKFEENSDVVLYAAEHLSGNKKAIGNLSKLWTKINANENDAVINFFEVDEDKMDNVLNIFVRVNSGGTVLSKSDLLFSTITSFWDKGRERIENLISEINKKGQKFNFNNDFIMRTCLCLMDLPIDLKVESFKKDSVIKIQQTWERIQNSICDTVDLLVEFGFCDENLISYNVVIPMIYYVYNKSTISNNSKAEMRKFIIVALTKKLFGGSSNTTIASVRSAIKENIKGEFNLSFFDNVRISGGRDFRITKEFIDEIFEDFRYGAYTFMILSILYPELKLAQISWHQDHLHPYTSFETPKLKKLGIDNETIERWQSNRNRLANLQLLEGRENQSKNKEPLKDWLKKGKAKFLPDGVSLELQNFDEFLEKRESLMKEQLTKILM